MHYEDFELDEHEEDAVEAGMSLLGTIHTHPDCDEARFGDTDLEASQESQETVMGICAVQTTERVDGKTKKLRRKIVRLEYWPCIRPLVTIRKDTPKRQRRSAAPVQKSRRRKR